MGHQQGQNPAASLGAAVAELRQLRDLTQAELAELMSAQGVDWRREQVLRVESGEREVSAHELLVLAHVLGEPLAMMYATAGYSGGLLQTARSLDGVQPVWPAASRKAASPRLRAYMTGDLRGRQVVRVVLRAWKDYQTLSGKPPTERAERAKLASLWREYEADPEAFTARAVEDGAIRIKGTGRDSK